MTAPGIAALWPAAIVALTSCSLVAPSREDYVGTPAPTSSSSSSASSNSGSSSGSSGNECGAASPNLLPNGSFENGQGGWVTFQGNLAVDTAPGAPDGTHVATLSSETGDFYSIDDDPDTVQNTVAGKTYFATAYVRAATASSMGKPVVVHLRQRPGMRMSDTMNWPSEEYVLDDTFQRICSQGTATVSDELLDIYIVQREAEPGDAFDVDDVVLQAP